MLLVCRVYSEIALSWKPFRIGHMCIYTFLLGVTDTLTSQNIDLSSWYTYILDLDYKMHITCKLQFQNFTPKNMAMEESVNLGMWLNVHYVCQLSVDSKKACDSEGTFLLNSVYP
jgi:hypothetical protein